MANTPRTRKRVRAFHRAPDGSAFQKCESCGVSVAIILAGMHECEFQKKDVKRFKGEVIEPQIVMNVNRIEDQPRSAFCFFIEEYTINHDIKGVSFIDMNRRLCQKWINMSKEEQMPYILKADKVNAAYEEALLKEANDIIVADDEADSEWKFDKHHFDRWDYLQRL